MLERGARLGPYEVIARIGSGGMGEVYRAVDHRLTREVAVKVLAHSLAGDSGRVARFQREARLLGALNHQNIAALYTVEECGTGHALIMELVEGETLAQRLTRRPLRTHEALPLARQVCDALHAAHAHGIIHRDLKPANIKITPAGAVKVLDFGIAKLADESDAASVSLSPLTASAPTLTDTGVLMGTPAYMSPEQANGLPADSRTDIWAFGCVLYEMLTGKRAFPGTEPISVLNAVLNLEPDWAALPNDVPPPVRMLLEKCLIKEPSCRIVDISVALFVLENADSLSAQRSTGSITLLSRRSRLRPLAVLAASALVVMLAGVMGWMRFGATPVPTTPGMSIRFRIPAPGALPAEMFTLSPNGRYLAFVADNGPTDQLWVQSLDTLEPRPLAGTTRAEYPFWSPDGNYIGFFADGKLKKIGVDGGLAQVIGDAADPRGATWNRNGVILLASGASGPIYRVSATGGVPTPVTRVVVRPGAGHRFPVFLPDGAHFLYHLADDNADAAGIFVGALDGSSAGRVLPGTSNALYVPPLPGDRTGHLLFRRESTLLAQPFNAETLRSSGEAIPVAERVASSHHDGFGAFSASGNGTIAYRTGSGVLRELVWTDRSGARIGAVTKPTSFGGRPAISPDQRMVAITAPTATGVDIWLQNLGRDVLSRFTLNTSGTARSPVWSPDGTRLAYAFQPASAYSYEIYIKPVNGRASEKLLGGGVNAYPTDWSSDGRWIVYHQQGDTTGMDLWLMPLEGDRRPIPYLQTPVHETNGRFAPRASDGPRWMAYQSDATGRNEIYIQSIPAGMTYQISSAGGTQPTWRGDGAELFYRVDRKLMAVPIVPGTRIEFGQPRELFANAETDGYDVAADGQRVLLNIPIDTKRVTAAPVTVVVGWTAASPK